MKIKKSVKTSLNKHKLGDLKSSEQLIHELYINLRKKVNYWASITKQTAQARMGYVGQHLVSIVTGYQGGKSGARGKDLILNKAQYAEIKTCYRVDQLGKCLNCHSIVASIETKCSYCSSTNIERKQDSKWLLSIRNDNEFAEILEPKFYYLVLFDFKNINNPKKIRASIWRVNSKTIGFFYCMIDYYLNIRTKSKSKAPFNLWPFQLKFYLMLPTLIYRSYILKGNIKTEVFYKKDHFLDIPKSIQQYSSANNLTKEKIIDFAKEIHFPKIKKLHLLNKKKLITQLDNFMKNSGGFDKQRANKLAKILYYRDIKHHVKCIPRKLRKIVQIYS